MTTIAYKDGIMASDTRLTSKSYIIPGECQKVFYTEGALVGISGSADEQLIHNSEFYKLKRPSDLPEWMNELEVEGRDWDLMVVFLDDPGIVYRVYITNEKEKSESGYFSITVDSLCGYAIGSGMEWAVAAMRFGKTAAEAVEFAKEFDCATGGSVMEYAVDEYEEED